MKRFFAFERYCTTYRREILAGFVLHPLVKTFQGRIRDVPAGMRLLSMASLAFYLFYPHHEDKVEAFHYPKE